MNINISVGVNQGLIQIISVKKSAEKEKKGKKKAKKEKKKNKKCVFEGEVREKEPTPLEFEDSSVGSENAAPVALLLVEGEKAAGAMLKKDDGKEIQDIAQKILEDLQDVYAPKKKDNMFLSNIYQQLQFDYGGEESFYYANKSERSYWCGSLLAFEVNAKGEKKLIKANSCRVRLCPLCAWRRSLKCYREMRIVYDYIKEQQSDYKFIFLTLTQRNVSAEELSAEIDKILYGFNRLMKLKDIDKICLGFIRSLEVTYNREANTYHPHIHVLIYTTNGLYSGRNYISWKKYKKLWADILGLDYLPETWVEKFKAKNISNAGKELAEMCKYSVKPSNYLFPDDGELSKEVTRVLDNCLANRRLLSYGGALRQARKKLLLSDEEVEDTSDIEVEDVTDEGYIELYRWHFGNMKYMHICGEERENLLPHIKQKVEEI